MKNEKRIEIRKALVTGAFVFVGVFLGAPHHML